MFSFIVYYINIKILDYFLISNQENIKFLLLDFVNKTLNY